MKKGITSKELNDFVDKIVEVLLVFQTSHPRLIGQDIYVIKIMLYNYIAFMINGVSAGTYKLSDLIYLSTRTSRDDPSEYASNYQNLVSQYIRATKNIVDNNFYLNKYGDDLQHNMETFPYLNLIITNTFLGMSDYKGNVIFSTDKKTFPTTENYELMTESDFYNLDDLFRNLSK